ELMRDYHRRSGPPRCAFKVDIQKADIHGWFNGKRGLRQVMLYSYTSSMCNDSWGRSSFARYLIEVNSEADLVEAVTIGIPSLIREDFTKETIRVKYEWRPPKCDKYEEEEEEVENVYDETANLFNTKTGGRSFFMAVVG
nr:zinc knuckle CX2CX4HX4C [Tanacetum cinerariifolium]